MLVTRDMTTSITLSVEFADDLSLKIKTHD